MIKRFVVFLFPMLAGCAGPGVEAYKMEKPELDLRRFFNGPVQGWGMFQDRSGQVVKRFKVDIRSGWNGDTGTLDETFTWSDGHTSRRVWTLREAGPGRYLGTAGDVIGTAEGEVAGNALHWRYELALDVDGRTWNVHFDDWMFLADDGVILNRSTMSKFGFRLGEVTLVLQRAP
jgi:hypothetical protein